jgi:alcohol dehydrogenase (cytochrome c)
MLYEITLNGERRKVVANFSRNGFYYTLDRANGSSCVPTSIRRK